MKVESRHKWLWLLPILLALLFNLNVLQNGFGWDDENMIPNLQAPQRWWDLLLRELLPASSQRADASYFRPLVTVSYYLDHALWGDNPFGFHLSVLLAHVLNTALVFWLAQALTETEKLFPPFSYFPISNFLPVLAASLFAVHPIHAEAVAWIAGRNDVLCTTFMLASMLLYIRFHRTRSPLVFGSSMIFFLLALLTKEIALGLILLFPLYDYLAYGSRFTAITSIQHPASSRLWRRTLFWGLISLVILGGYFWMRSEKITLPYGDPSLPDLISLRTAWEILTATGLYLQLMLFPYPRHPYIAALSASPLSLILTAVVLALVFTGVSLAVLRRRVVLGTGLAWMLSTLAPSIPISVSALHLGAAMAAAERYLYAPSVGFLIALVWLILWGLDRLSITTGRSPQKVWIVAGLLFMALGTAWGWESWMRNAVWQSPLTFWQAAVAASPEAGFPHAELGIQYTRVGRYAEAEAEFQAALRGIIIPTEEVRTLSNLGNLYTLQGRYPEAEAALKTALSRDPGHDEIHWHLSELYFAMSVREEKTTAEGRRVMAYDPVLFSQGERYLVEALQLQPLLQLYLEAGKIYWTFGEKDKAKQYFEKVIQLSPAQKTQAVQTALHYLEEYSKAKK